MSKEKQFYYRNNYFETYDEMMRYVDKHQKSELTEEEIDYVLGIIKKDILADIDVYKIKLTVGEFNFLIDKWCLPSEIVNEIRSRN
jgi:hypothetical protein